MTSRSDQKTLSGGRRGYAGFAHNAQIAHDRDRGEGSPTRMATFQEPPSGEGAFSITVMSLEVSNPPPMTTLPAGANASKPEKVAIGPMKICLRMYSSPATPPTGPGGPGGP